jgi:hypothetical protein
MRERLALVSLVFWLLLMVLVYRNSPEWFFMPFFFVSTLAYLRLMDVRKSS